MINQPYLLSLALDSQEAEADFLEIPTGGASCDLFIIMSYVVRICEEKNTFNIFSGTKHKYATRKDVFYSTNKALCFQQCNNYLAFRELYARWNSANHVTNGADEKSVAVVDFAL